MNDKYSEVKISKPEVKMKPVKKAEVTRKTKPPKSTNLKELIKKQAECNIGLVGHVDHGMN